MITNQHIMNLVFSNYYKYSHTPSDINQHLPTLAKYAADCDSVIELGVRGCISSWAFCYGLINNGKQTKKLILNDIEPCEISLLLEAAKSPDVGVDISFQWINDLEMCTDNLETDLTFIDTWHVYAQLKRELEKFSKITKKYIIMHDTVVDAIKGETIRLGLDAAKQSLETGYPIEEINRGLVPAIHDFLQTNTDWVLFEHYENNNGLTILKHV
jgi:hypothetical protein